MLIQYTYEHWFKVIRLVGLVELLPLLLPCQCGFSLKHNSGQQMICMVMGAIN
jgi:hypothetical protein